MNNAFAFVQIVGVIGVAWLIGRILGPLATALAKRVEGRSSTVTPDPAVADLREQVELLEERLDFVERALVQQKDRAEPPRPLPKQREIRVSTPV